MINKTGLYLTDIFVALSFLQVVLPQRENKRIVLKRADSWKWTTENHQKQFPKEFKEATRAFLLAYYKHYNSSKEYDVSAFAFSVFLLFLCAMKSD